MGVNIQRIMVTIDFSANSIRAISYADAMAEQLGCEIELLHVVEQSPYEVYQQKGFLEDVPIYEPVDGFPSAGSKFVIKDVMEETKSQLEGLIPDGSKERFLSSVRHGHALDEVLAEIEDYKPDLLVMCTHGWSGLTHLLLGSLTEKLVRHSPIPVLTVPPAKDKK